MQGMVCFFGWSLSFSVTLCLFVFITVNWREQPQLKAVLTSEANMISTDMCVGLIPVHVTHRSAFQFQQSDNMQDWSNDWNKLYVFKQ